jgi:integrase
LRPAEAVNLRESDCELPASGWGRIHLSKTAPEVGKRYTDSGTLHDDKGSPWPPDYVYRRFRALAKSVGVPVIKLHEGGRHTSASLARDAEVDPEIRRKTLGHADQAMTSHYTHIEADAHRAAAEAVARLVDRETGHYAP